MNNLDFGDRFKKIRIENNLTQKQISEKLNVSRQAVSNWENNRNLPDIEMLITIANKFNLSLDELIFKGSDKNNMTKKLIKDGSENRRAKINLISITVGASLLLIGLALIGIKAVSVEYIDAKGILYENFFLLPIAFLFIISGTITFFVIGIKNIIYKVRSENKIN